MTDYVGAETTLDLDLGALLSRVLLAARNLVDDEAAWSEPLAASQAGREMSAQDARTGTDRPTGSWPWLLAMIVARWTLRTAVEFATDFANLLANGGAASTTGVLCRAILEHTSLTFWLLAPDIDSDGRLARALNYQLHTARQTKRAFGRLGVDEDEDPAGYGEMPETVVEQIRALGCSVTETGGIRCGASCVDWPRYSDRVEQLVRFIWPQHKLPYAVLSAIGHAELLGFHRMGMPGDANDPQQLAQSGTPEWLRWDAYLALGALVLSVERTNVFLGRPNQAAELRVLAARLAGWSSEPSIGAR
jgi:hypothetical protein